MGAVHLIVPTVISCCRSWVVRMRDSEAMEFRKRK
jgi:hypothetical protein